MTRKPPQFVASSSTATTVTGNWALSGDQPQFIRVYTDPDNVGQRLDMPFDKTEYTWTSLSADTLYSFSVSTVFLDPPDPSQPHTEDEHAGSFQARTQMDAGGGTGSSGGESQFPSVTAFTASHDGILVQLRWTITVPDASLQIDWELHETYPDGHHQTIAVGSIQATAQLPGQVLEEQGAEQIHVRPPYGRWEYRVRLIQSGETRDTPPLVVTTTDPRMVSIERAKEEASGDVSIAPPDPRLGLLHPGESERHIPPIGR